MQIELSSQEAEQLARHAAAAGFSSAEEYVAEFVHTLAERPDMTNLCAPLTDEELAASLAMIDRGMEEIRAGKGVTIEEARRRTLAALSMGDE